MLDNDSSSVTKTPEEYRQAGNKLFKGEKYFGALTQYNKALATSQNEKNRASLCYANRSAVYMELGYYKHCLHNIELAEEGYPRENIQKLYDRREKCLKLMKNSPDKSVHPFEHKFNLSYEPNPRIPFFIDAIQLKKDETFGNHLITTRKLKAGDVIAVISDPWKVPIFNLNFDYVFGCYTCFNANNGDLIPGSCCKGKISYVHEKLNIELKINCEFYKSIIFQLFSAAKDAKCCMNNKTWIMKLSTKLKN